VAFEWTDEDATSIVAISPPAFRARTGRHNRNADSALGDAEAAIAADRSMIISFPTPGPGNGSVDGALEAQWWSGWMRRFGLTAVMLLQACAWNDSHSVRPLRPLELATAPYEGTVRAQLAGSLMYEGGCLLFREDRTGAQLLPLWPTGSIFNGTSVIFHEPGKTDQPILIAQQFVMAGRAVPWEGLSPAFYGPFEHQCPARPFLVSQVRPAD
jgi:hypothetical protein